MSKQITFIEVRHLSDSDNKELNRYDELSTGVTLEVIARIALLEVCIMLLRDVRLAIPTDDLPSKVCKDSFFDYCEEKWWKWHVDNDDTHEVMDLTGKLYDKFKVLYHCLLVPHVPILTSSKGTLGYWASETITDVVPTVEIKNKDTLELRTIIKLR